jgi:hypothetical protein
MYQVLSGHYMVGKSKPISVKALMVPEVSMYPME